MTLELFRSLMWHRSRRSALRTFGTSDGSFEGPDTINVHLAPTPRSEGVHRQHNRFFGGFAGFARPLSSRVVFVVYAKVPWLLLHAKYRTCTAKQAAAPFFSRSQHTHNTRREKLVTQNASSQVLFSIFTSKKLLMSLIIPGCCHGIKLLLVHNLEHKPMLRIEGGLVNFL